MTLEMVQTPHLLALSAELRVMIWQYVFTDYATIVRGPRRISDATEYGADAWSEDESDSEEKSPYVEYSYQPGKLIPVRRPPEYVYRVSSSNGVRARYSGHPLFYVSRWTSEETVDMFFCTATIDLAPLANPFLKGVLPPVASLCQMLRRLSLCYRELETLFYYECQLVRPCVDAAENDCVDSMKILSLPNLDYLEVKNKTESQCLVDDGSDDWIRDRHLLLSLINYKKSFTCELQVVATNGGSEGETQFTAVYSAGKVKVAYSGQFKKNLECEKLLHKAMYLDGGANMIKWMTEPGQQDWKEFEPGSEARRHLREIIDDDRWEVFEKALDEFCASSKSS
ncbi:hypothetical protein LTR70_003921 [Exophiala xenobiotica]|uniref:Uncharacterized protein n=1 Tax=Lithohypha guttulata TaxID=1690604 RepID=A0ABR0KEU2_9EURO|nr:hypothetical protein LTR24_003389 [Lithohypha guttulata]KAK5322240.1 hypothetical protein LTR70_003921 [Exophiala xenobiotica]